VYGASNSPQGYDFFAAGSGQNYGSPSSIRWKSNIESVADPLGKLSQIRGVYFDWDEEHGSQRDIGFIDEEVGEVLPEIVAYEEDGEFVTGVDYSKMTPLLVEAANALRVENENLRTSHRELQDRLEQLESIVEQLARREQEKRHVGSWLNRSTDCRPDQALRQKSHTTPPS